MLCCEHIKVKYDNLTLKNKIFSMVLLTSLLLTSIASLGLHSFSHAANEQLYKAVSGNLSLSSQTIANQLKNVETLSDVAIASSIIQDSLDQINTTKDAQIWTNCRHDINNILINYQNAYKSIGVSNLVLYNNFFNSLTNYVILKKTNPAVIQTAINAAREKSGAIVWTIDYEQHYAILSREIRKAKGLDLSHLGDILIFVDLEQIVTYANTAINTYNNTSYLLYDEQNCIYSTEKLSNKDSQYLISHTKSPYHIIHYRNHSYFALKQVLPYYEWSYINLVPYDQIAKVSTFTRRLIFVMFIICLIITLYLSKRFMQYILKDFDLLIKKMKYFSDTKLKIPQIDVDYSQRIDEISRLHQNFDTMAEEIQELVNKNYVNQILSRDAQIKALESQINPHFLYNTLETINWRAKAMHDNDTSAMVESLGNLLRATLSNKESLVTLHYELNLINNYMTIQKIRFEERLSFHTHIDNTLQNALVPPFSLQPLLENAIQYGLEKVIDVCEIGIKVYQKDMLLIIEVSNEGSTFDDNLLEKLSTGSKKAHGFGIGLVNINQRIQLLFGNSYGLSFRNESNLAIATITIPYKEKELEHV